MKGSCLCGRIQFKLGLDSINMYQCHCEQCRKQTGTASSCGGVVCQTKFSWLSGIEDISQWEKPTGFSSHFCRHCGSSVPNKFREGEYYWVPIGLIDSACVKTVANIYVCERESWSNVDAGINQFSTKPAIEDLVQLLVD